MGVALGEYWRGVIRGSDLYDVVFCEEHESEVILCIRVGLVSKVARRSSMGPI